MMRMVKKKIPLHLFVVLSKIALVDIIVPYLQIRYTNKIDVFMFLNREKKRLHVSNILNL